MTSPFAEQIQSAMANLQEQRAKMVEAQKELQKATASVTSKDRMVTVKVGAQGQVVSMTFLTTAYQDMAPAELASKLTHVLNEARAQMGEQVIEKMRSFDGIGAALRTSIGGATTDLDELMAPLRAMRPGLEEEEAKKGKKQTKKQKEFHG